MRNLRNNQYPFESASRGKVASMVAVLALAQALYSTPSAAEETSTQGSQTPTSVASAMTATIRAGLPIGTINPNKELEWAPVGAKCFIEYITDAEISQYINGLDTYFEIKQLGDSRRSLVAEPIKAVREISIGSPISLQSPRFVTTVGDISINAQHQPITEVENIDHQIETTLVGYTAQFKC